MKPIKRRNDNNLIVCGAPAEKLSKPANPQPCQPTPTANPTRPSLLKALEAIVEAGRRGLLGPTAMAAVTVTPDLNLGGNKTVFATGQGGLCGPAAAIPPKLNLGSSKAVVGTGRQGLYGTAVVAPPKLILGRSKAVVEASIRDLRCLAARVPSKLGVESSETFVETGQYGLDDPAVAVPPKLNMGNNNAVVRTGQRDLYGPAVAVPSKLNVGSSKAVVETGQSGLYGPAAVTTPSISSLLHPGGSEAVVEAGLYGLREPAASVPPKLNLGSSKAVVETGKHGLHSPTAVTTAAAIPQCLHLGDKVVVKTGQHGLHGPAVVATVAIPSLFNQGGSKAVVEMSQNAFHGPAAAAAVPPLLKMGGSKPVVEVGRCGLLGLAPMVPMTIPTDFNLGNINTFIETSRRGLLGPAPMTRVTFPPKLDPEGNKMVVNAAQPGWLGPIPMPAVMPNIILGGNNGLVFQKAPIIFQNVIKEFQRKKKEQKEQMKNKVDISTFSFRLEKEKGKLSEGSPVMTRLQSQADNPKEKPHISVFHTSIGKVATDVESLPPPEETSLPPPEETSLLPPKEVWICGNSVILSSKGRAKIHPHGLQLGIPTSTAHVYWHGIKAMMWDQLVPLLHEIYDIRSSPSIIIIHLGENDLLPDNSFPLIIKMKNDLGILRRAFPDAIICWSALLPRFFWKDVQKPHLMEEAVEQVNREVAEFCKESGIHLLTHDLFTSDNSDLFFLGTNNLSNEGADILTADLKKVVEYFVGVNEY